VIQFLQKKLKVGHHGWLKKYLACLGILIMSCKTYEDIANITQSKLLVREAHHFAAQFLCAPTDWQHQAA